MRKILNKNEKGITLIALVITIIVILILAGVAISMLSGESGILRKAANAKQYTEESTELEGVRLAATAAMINKKHIIEDQTKLQEQLDKHFDNAVATGDATSGYKVTIGSNVYNISSAGEVIKTEPEILQSDIWSVSLISSTPNEKPSPGHNIKVKSKYKKISLQEYKEKYILNIYRDISPFHSLVMGDSEDFDDFLILFGRMGGIDCTSVEDILEYYKENGQEITRDELVSSYILDGATVDGFLENAKTEGIIDKDIQQIEQEWEDLEQTEEVPDEVKNKTYTIKYPDGRTEDINGEELDKFIGRCSPKGNGSNEISISDGEKETVLRININNYCIPKYEDEHYFYYWDLDDGLGYGVIVKDKTLTQYGKILTEVEGISVGYMEGAFRGCTNLTQAPDIPSGVNNMDYTFEGCTNLTQAPDIPSGVYDMSCIFEGCTNLSGVLRINSTNLRNCTDALKDAGTNGTGLIVVVPNDEARALLIANSGYDSSKVQIVASEEEAVSSENE